jgi:hypothetical protein
LPVTHEAREQFKTAGRALIQKQDRLPHGAWLKWVEANLEFSVDTAERYMKLAREEETYNSAACGFNSPPLDADDLVSLPGPQESPPTAETNWVDKQCESVEWYTPPAILERVEFYFGGPIPLDPATAPHNPTGATRFITEDEDGLAQEWLASGSQLKQPFRRRRQY